MSTSTISEWVVVSCGIVVLLTVTGIVVRSIIRGGRVCDNLVSIVVSCTGWFAKSVSSNENDDVVAVPKSKFLKPSPELRVYYSTDIPGLQTDPISEVFKYVNKYPDVCVIIVGAEVPPSPRYIDGDRIPEVNWTMVQGRKPGCDDVCNSSNMDTIISYAQRFRSSSTVLFGSDPESIRKLQNSGVTAGVVIIPESTHLDRARMRYDAGSKRLPYAESGYGPDHLRSLRAGYIKVASESGIEVLSSIQAGAGRDVLIGPSCIGKSYMCDISNQVGIISDSVIDYPYVFPTAAAAAARGFRVLIEPFTDIDNYSDSDDATTINSSYDSDSNV